LKNIPSPNEEESIGSWKNILCLKEEKIGKHSSPKKEKDRKNISSPKKQV